MDKLVENTKVDLNLPDFDNTPPLHKAVVNCHLPVTRRLLSLPLLDANRKCRFGYTALILAAGLGNVGLVELLLERDDIEVNHVESNNCSALMIACMHGFFEVS